MAETRHTHPGTAQNASRGAIFGPSMKLRPIGKAISKGHLMGRKLIREAEKLGLVLNKFGRSRCAYCKKPIIKIQRTQRYCSTTCRARDWKDRQPLPPQAEHSGPKTRSEIMRAIRSPSRFEEEARPLAQKLARCRLHRHPDGMPGYPNFANKRRRVVVFIHGCFWHGCPRHFRVPKTRPEFWRSKIEHNRAHDARWRRMYRAGSWRVITIWEHSIRRTK